MVFCKFECLSLLNDYRTVVWSDYDIVVLDEISEVFSPTASLKMLFQENASHRSFLHPIDEYDMNSLGMCASLFALSDSLQYTDMYGFCYRQLRTYDNNLYMPGQAIFDIMLQEFSLKPVRLPHGTYTPHPKDRA